MKCSKCGFNSFEYYDSCIKCSNDLTGYKLTYSITPLVLPQDVKNRMAAEFRSAESDNDQSGSEVESHDDIFAFDLPDGAPAPAATGNDDPFNFDEPPQTVGASGSSSSEDDVFANLLESTSQVEASPEAESNITSGSGSLELESFSWDDPPANKELDESLDSLFGDASENSKK
jgi:hypothetical protein